MNSQQYYVTGDLVHPNTQVVNVIPQQLVVNDIFEIPDIESPVVSNTNIAPSQIIHTIQQPAQQINKMNNLVSTTQYMNTDSLRFIKSINHSAMTDVMNEVSKQKQKIPSVSSQHSGLSVQPSKPQQHGYSPPSGNAARSSNKPPSQNVQTSSAVDNSSPADTNTIKKNISKPCKNTLNKKVIVEEEDKDSAIDYDDDDTEIKKIKLSLFQFAKDVTFNLIFAIPFLQKARLHAMLRDSNLAINQIERIFDEFKDRFSQFELETIKKYVCEDGIRDQLNFILESGFNKILSDGVIDINDAPQFNQLVYFIIKSFNDINQGKVYRFYISREHVMLLLHFVLKSVFTLTLKGQEEQMALGLLDTSFKLVQLEVLPIVSKRWYHKFRLCKAAKQIEDIIE